MKCSKELKIWINRQRKFRGKENGVVRWLFDCAFERKFYTSKKTKSYNDN